MITEKSQPLNSVLFVCTGNTCRSPMAKALFEALCAEAGLATSALSAGVSAADGFGPSVGALSAMQRLGLDISDHRSRMVNADMLEDASLILCMEHHHALRLKTRFPAHAAKIFTLNGCAFGADEPIEDPFGGTAEEYEHCAQGISRALAAIIAAGA